MVNQLLHYQGNRWFLVVGGAVRVWQLVVGVVLVL